MEPELEKQFREYSEFVLYGEDSEAERYLAVRPELKGLVVKLRNEESLKNSFDRCKSRLDLRIMLMGVNIPKNCAGILAKELYEYDSILGILIDDYNQLTNGGLSPFASTGALVYGRTLVENPFDIPLIITNYHVSCSTYESRKITFGDMELGELSMLCRDWRYIKEREDKKDFILGMMAAE